jgi:hypothetical protein
LQPAILDAARYYRGLKKRPRQRGTRSKRSPT